MRLTRHAGWIVAALCAVAIFALLSVVRPRTSAVYGPGNLIPAKNARGFYQPETDPAGDHYIWTAPDAALTVPLIGTRPVTLVLALRSAAVNGGPDAPVIVLVNDREVAQLRPDPHNPEFQTFVVHVSPPRAAAFYLTLRATPFQPGKGDPRILGTTVQHITVDKSAAWSSLTRRIWLYWAAVSFGLLAAALLFGARHGFAFADVAAVGACLVGAAMLLLAAALLLRMGQIDAERYEFWLFGTLYLAGFFLAAALRIPVGSGEARTVWQRWWETGWARRHHTALTRAGHTLLFLAPALVGLHFLAAPGTADVQDKLLWMHNVATDGLSRGYQESASNYPPGTFALLWPAASIAPHLGIGLFVAYKCSLLIFLPLCGLVVLRWTRNVGVATMLQVALILNSAVLGYNDVSFLPTLLLALWALSAKRFGWFTVLLTVTFLIKWQPAIIAPVLFLAVLSTLRDQVGWRGLPGRAARSLLLPGVATLALAALVFRAETVTALRRAIAEHWLSANALNFNWILTQMLQWHDPSAYRGATGIYARSVLITSAGLTIATKTLFIVVSLLVLYRFLRGPKTFDTALYFAFLAYLAYFLFNTSVHENHLIPAVALAALLSARNARYLPVFALTAIIANLNLYLFYGLDGALRGAMRVQGIDATVLLAVLNVALFIALLARGPLGVNTRAERQIIEPALRSS